MSTNEQSGTAAGGHGHEEGELPHLPPPTPWPLVMGVGMTLMMAGLVVFLRGARPIGEGMAPLAGAVLFFIALIMMLRNDIKAFEEGGGHHG